jgi:hypothetical protein
LGHRPDLIQVEAEVFVNEDIPQRNDLRPGHFEMLASHWLGDATGGLSDDLQVVDSPDLEHLVVLKSQAIRDPLFSLAMASRISLSRSESLLIERSRRGKRNPLSRVLPSRR